jgi:predicted RNA methylase
MYPGKKYIEKPEVVLSGVKDLDIPEVKLSFIRKTNKKFAGKILTSGDAARFLRMIFGRGQIELQERFVVLYLDRANKIIGYYRHTIGGITGVVADVRLILSVALKCNAVSIVLCHNHPSGNLKPSDADIQLTKKVKEAGIVMDIGVIDHIILTRDGHYSFADEGLAGIQLNANTGLSKAHEKFVGQIITYLQLGVKHDKRSLEKLAAQYGIFDKTEVKELTELAIADVARSYARNMDYSVEARYKQIVSLYHSQVNLSHRTSQSILLQQYSTPAPIAFLAGIFCGMDKKGKYFEPSAGNGLLTITANPKDFTVNEIDNTRNRHLKAQEFAKVMQQDASKPFEEFQKEFDAVITNPPFGKLTRPVSIDGYPIKVLDHLMVIYALDTMKDNGRAAFIIGGHTDYDDKGRVQAGSHRIFLNYLYSRYNVVDVIPIDGSRLYSRQGTSFDTRLILIDGRKPMPQGVAPVFDKERDTQVQDFQDLYKRVTDAMKYSKRKEEEIPVLPEDEQADPKWSYMESAYKIFWFAHVELPPGALLLVEYDGKFYGFQHVAWKMEHYVQARTYPIIIGGERTSYVEIPAEDLDFYLNRLHNQRHTVYLKRSTPSLRKSMEEDMAQIEKALDEELRKMERGEELGAPYVPASESCIVLNTVVPDSMDFETRKALEFIQKEVGGNIDEFVRQRLGYASKIELCKALSAEQTDGVAMAIYNIEAREQGMIIGDQTGIGKGRVAAAMIRYAVLQGHKPIFITEKPNLFSDIYRDLIAIGSGNLVPFIVNGRESKTDIKDENGDILYQAPAPAEQQVFFKEKRVPAFADFVVATYSQFNSPEKKPEKPSFLNAIAEGTIMILDESHNASGSSQVGEFLQGVLAKSKGVVFLSATFAKRPDNMPIYAMKTAIRDANMTKEELINAINKGGVALQEVLASQLVKEGQMLRRERSFEGVEVNYISLDELATEHRAIADNITEILREIIAFQATSVDTLVDELDEIAVAEGKEVKLREGTSQAGVDNQPYFSKVFQVINQMLFAIKAEAVADRAIMRLKEGKKPVIAFSSTMGSFIEQMENESGLPVSDGDMINADFSEVLLRGLDGVLRYTVTTPEGNKVYKKFELSELSKAARDQYLAIADKIKKMASGIYLSPIDIIVQKIQRAGYRVAEVTGRKFEVNINPQTNKGIVVTRNRVNTNDAFRQFNNNEVDVLLINQSGSTGASAHAIVTKTVPASEVKQRVMIVLQAELDINTEVQKRGRINRTGQILPPIYDYVMSAIPAEKRLMMMLQKKLKSLDANTTSNQKQSTKILDVPDFLNKYGDKVVTQYLSENKDINKLLGDPLGLADTSNERGEILEDAAHKVSGRVAVLSTQMQADFYNEISVSYNEYVEYLKQIGEYDLEVEAMNLEAATLSKKVVRMGKGGDSEFGTDSILEKIEANVLRKPFTATELGNILKESLGNSDAESIQRNIDKDYQAFSESQLEGEIAETEEYYEKLIEEIPKEKKALKIQAEDGEGAYRQFIKQREAELTTAKEKQEEKVRTSLANRQQYLTSIFKFFFIGKNLLYPVSSYTEGDVKTKAVFLGFIIDKKKKNPYAPSNIRLRFGIASSAKYIAMPASYTKDINAIMGASYGVATGSMEDTLRMWESSIKAADHNRNTRYVITGNLLQAFSQYKGKLVSYTLKNGGIQKGILMPEYWEPGEEMEDAVMVPVARAEKVISSLVQGNGITTENGTSIFNTGDELKIIVPGSRQRGGDVYLDADILELVERNNFEKASDKMVAYLKPEKLRAFLAILQSKFNDSVKLQTRQFDLVKDTKGEKKARNPIKILSPEEVQREMELRWEMEMAEAELELEMEMMQLNIAA